MKRIFFALLALLMLILSACGSTVDSTPTAAAGTPASVTDPPSAAPTATPEPDYSAFVAELANFCVVNMFTCYYDNAVVTRFDFDSDGVQDWLVYKQADDPHGAWLMLDGHRSGRVARRTPTTSAPPGTYASSIPRPSAPPSSTSSMAPSATPSTTTSPSTASRAPNSPITAASGSTMMSSPWSGR